MESSEETPAITITEIADAGADSAQTLEETARQALDCPCVANLRDGPCGPEFSSAFICFVKSQEHEKGAECVESFLKLQGCMSENKKYFSGTPASRESGRDAERGSVDDFRDAGGDGTQEIDDSERPPPVPEEAIRYPPWYKK